MHGCCCHTQDTSGHWQVKVLHWPVEITVCLCRHQIWLLYGYFFVQRGEKHFSLWQKELLSVCPCQRFLQEQSLHST